MFFKIVILMNMRLCFTRSFPVQSRRFPLHRALSLSNDDSTPLSTLLDSSRKACDAIGPVTRSIYDAVNSPEVTQGEQSKTIKADKSHFTIADGLVQHLLAKHVLFALGGMVGEENAEVNIHTRPYTVDNLGIPPYLWDEVDRARVLCDAIGHALAEDTSVARAMSSLTAFVDPIDGTQQFVEAQGEECTICIGFAREGQPVAGLLYRPIPFAPAGPATATPMLQWAAGALEEGYCEQASWDPSNEGAAPPRVGATGLKDIAGTDVQCGRGFLTSRGSISPFLGELITRLDATQVPTGGVGNKAMMLLEGRGKFYVLDRGVSRWDTCAAQAVLEAYGGMLVMLAPAMATPRLFNSYTYASSALNLDFARCELTRYNAARPLGSDSSGCATDVSDVKAYANVQGLLAATSKAVADEVITVLEEGLACPPVFT